VSWIKKF